MGVVLHIFNDVDMPFTLNYVSMTTHANALRPCDASYWDLPNGRKGENSESSTRGVLEVFESSTIPGGQNAR